MNRDRELGFWEYAHRDISLKFKSNSLKFESNSLKFKTYFCLNIEILISQPTMQFPNIHLSTL